MSWCVFWILDLSPKEASGDSEDKSQEENTNDDVSWQLDEDDTGSCCGNSSYSTDDDDNKSAEVCWVFSKKVMQMQQHINKGEVINNKSSVAEEKELVADMEARQRRLREESKEFWDACIAHGY